MTIRGTIFLAFLLGKHFLVDFVWQTDQQIKGKGRYGNLIGMSHSLHHGVWTILVAAWITPWAVAVGLIDSLIHYHVDWLKMRFGCQDMNSKRFWTHLGLDQLAHGLTYLALAVVFL